MKKLKALFRKAGSAHQYRPKFGEYLELYFRLHWGHYILITIVLATGTILLQAMWSIHSLLK